MKKGKTTFLPASEGRLTRQWERQQEKQRRRADAKPGMNHDAMMRDDIRAQVAQREHRKQTI
mgnify:CR=1 FL=1